MSTAWIMLIAIGLDAALSWPAALYARIGHPVTWIGALISKLEARLNQGAARRAKGGSDGGYRHRHRRRIGCCGGDKCKQFRLK